MQQQKQQAFIAAGGQQSADVAAPRAPPAPTPPIDFAIVYLFTLIKIKILR